MVRVRGVSHLGSLLSFQSQEVWGVALRVLGHAPECTLFLSLWFHRDFSNSRGTRSKGLCGGYSNLPQEGRGI